MCLVSQIFEEVFSKLLYNFHAPKFDVSIIFFILRIRFGFGLYFTLFWCSEFSQTCQRPLVIVACSCRGHRCMVNFRFCFVSLRVLCRFERKSKVCCFVGRVVLLTSCCDIECNEMVVRPRVVHVLGCFWEFHVQNVAQAAILLLSSEVRLSAEIARTSCYILAAQTARIVTNTSGPVEILSGAHKENRCELSTDIATVTVIWGGTNCALI